MIINRIILSNLGPFVEKNIISAESTNEKSIVLIGGKNGAGKTTFFNAIRFCLYGCKALGYEVNNASYYSKITQLLNDRAMLNENNEFYCRIELSFNDGEHFGVYSVQRNWYIKNGNISEKREYFEGRRLLDEEESFDFENLLLHLIPPDLFNFYFFDGEKISTFLSEDGTSNNFRNAFIKISGLDNLDLLVECFRKNSEVAMKDKKIFKDYQKSLKEYNDAKIVFDELTEKINSLDSAIGDINNQITTNYKSYIKSGGIGQKELEKLNQELINEEGKREAIRKELKEYANNGLPFVILKNQLKIYLDTLVASKTNNNIAVTKELINSVKGRNIFEKYLSKTEINNILKEIDLIKSSNDDQVFYKISDNEYLKIISQINNKISINSKYYSGLENEIKLSLERSKDLREALSKVSTEKYEQYSLQESNLQKQLNSLIKQKENLSTKVLDISVNFKIKETNYQKCLKDYEADLKKVSVHDISSKAYLEFSKLESKLYEKNIELVNEYFMMAFDSLINKRGLIDGIYINKELSVYPYRLVKSHFNEVEKLVKENGKENFINKYGEKAYLVFKNTNRKTFDLPIKIRGTLSEGENQIYLMSLYLALTKLKILPMPFIIDTPFGRIDNEHRQNILSNFFLKLDGQLIILSTDEEITEPYIKVMKKKISNYYLFKNNGAGKTDIIPNKYFCEVK